MARSMDENVTRKYPVFSERLRLLRHNSGMTQERVAGLLNVQRTTYAKYETGQSMPQQDTLLAITELFGVSLDYMLGRVDGGDNPRELRDDGTLPGMDTRATAMLSVFSRLTPEQQESLLDVATRFNDLNLALRATKNW